MTVDTVVSRTVRPLTNEEISHYFTKGWTVARGLIAPEWADELLEASKRLLGEDGEAEVPAGSGRNTISFFREFYGGSFREPHFDEFIHNAELGRSLSKLLYGGKEGAVRAQCDFVFVKLPEARANSVKNGWGAGATAFHQDILSAAPVLGDMVTLQVALGDNTPEMGTMRFYEGSHKLGSIFHPGGPLDDPRIEDCELSEPITLAPGDVTIHSCFTVHGAGTNQTDKPRWNAGGCFFPADAPYTGKSEINWPNVDQLHANGEVTIGKPLAHELMPEVFRP